jgi:CRP/FNR family cyclic AMP-dependent transcriptional regulator
VDEFGIGEPKEEPQKAQLRTGSKEVLSRLVVDKGKIIFQEGQDSTDLFMIESGRIGVYKTIDHKQVALAVIEKGTIFGEMAAFTSEKRSATTIALEPAVLVRIPKTIVMQKISSCDPFVKALIDILINNLSRANERYVAKNQTYDKLIADLKSHAVEVTPSP